MRILLVEDEKNLSAALCRLLLHLAKMDSLGRNYTAPLSDGERKPLRRLLLKGSGAEGGEKP